MNTPDLSGWTSNNEEPRYSRAQALADGALIDVSSVSKQVGYKVPVAVTELVWTFLAPSERDRRHGQTLHSRLRDVLEALKRSAEYVEALIRFDVDIVDLGDRRTWRLQAIISVDENGEPTVTIMFPHEA